MDGTNGLLHGAGVGRGAIRNRGRGQVAWVHFTKQRDDASVGASSELVKRLGKRQINSGAASEGPEESWRSGGTGVKGFSQKHDQSGSNAEEGRGRWASIRTRIQG